jgi:hypothetical protein
MAAVENGSGELYGVLAEFDNVDDLVRAAREVRDAGYRRWDTYSPFPVHGMIEAMGLKDSFLPWIVLAGGVAGCLGGLALQWWTNAIDYPYLISGKPLFSLPANIPVAFETTILLSALAAVGGMFFLNDLPRLYHPVFKSERFRRVTDDGFFLCIEATDPIFQLEETERFLRGLGAESLERLEE